MMSSPPYAPARNDGEKTKLSSPRLSKLYTFSNKKVTKFAMHVFTNTNFVKVIINVY